MKTNKLLYYSALTLFFVVLGTQSFAQFDVKGKVKSKVEEKVDEKINKGPNTPDEPDDSENQETEELNSEVEENYETNEPEQEAVQDNKPKLESYTEYDFVPGDQILFFEDFSQDAIGDFPALWTSNGGGEVKTLNIAPGKWLHMNGDGSVYCFMNRINFPDNFIVEFDIIPDAEFTHGYQLSFYNDRVDDQKELNDDLYPGSEGVNIDIKYDGWQTLGYRDEMDWIIGSSEKNMVIREQVNHVIIWVQKRRVRIYHGGLKVLDVPTNVYAGTSFNRFRFNGWDRNASPYVSNIKITTAAPDMRSKLLTEGKLISYGIYFDSGKDVVKPESYGSIKEISAVLKENPEVKIMIVGHTDSDGDDAMNLDLSKRRAANVKSYLVKEFGIAADRISTDGKGETQPIVQNTSVENKAKNRRVEFIKL